MENITQKNKEEFQYQWLILMLCRELLPRKDMLAILKHYSMSFFGVNWENTTKLEEMGWVILHDVKENELFVFLSKYLEENYPKLFSFEEACKIFNAMFYLKNEIELMEVWLSMVDDSPYVLIMKKQLDCFKEKRKKGEFDENPTMAEKRNPTGLFKEIVMNIVLALYALAIKSYTQTPS